MRSRSSRTSASALAALLALIGGLLTLVATPASAWGGPSQEISYINYVNGIGEVFTMSPDGTHKTQITIGGATKKCDPAFSPDGTQIAYAANDGGVYVINNAPQSATNPPVRLNESPNWDWRLTGSRRPTWSPGGSTIVFPMGIGVRPTSHDTDIHNLYMVQRVGTGWGAPAQLTNLTAGNWALQPRFSKAGTALSYSFRAAGQTGYVLKIMNWTGVVPSPLPTEAPGTSMPSAGDALLSSWSPSGLKIAYVSSCSGGVQVRAVTRSATGAWTWGPATQVTTGGGCGAAWSSTDENKITYADSSRVYVLDLAGNRKGVNLGAGSQPGW